MYILTVKIKSSTQTDSRNRRIETWADGPTLKVFAIGPAEGKEEESQEASAYSDSRVLYIKGPLVMSDGNPLQTSSRVVWSGFDWDIVKTTDYTTGPWSKGGSTVLIRKVSNPDG